MLENIKKISPLTKRILEKDAAEAERKRQDRVEKNKGTTKPLGSRMFEVNPVPASSDRKSENQ